MLHTPPIPFVLSEKNPTHGMLVFHHQGSHRKALGRGKSTMPPNLPGARRLCQRCGMAAIHQQPLHWLWGQDGISLGCSFGPVHAGQRKGEAGYVGIDGVGAEAHVLGGLLNSICVHI